MGSINITLANGQLGATAQTNDGICGLVMTGAIDDGGYALGTPILITNVSDLADEGITALGGNAYAVRQITQFYAQAGEGAQLYLMLVENTLTIADMADKAISNGAVKLLDYAEGKIKVLGLLSDDELVPDVVVTDAINEDVYTALTNMQAMGDEYAEADQMPFRCIMGGSSYTGLPGDLANLNTNDTNRSCVVVGDSATGTGACVGLALGVAASISVETKISRVANGALTITTAFYGENTLEESPDDAAIIEEQGFITLKKYKRKSGYYFTGDKMAVAATDDYAMLARGRVVDKAQIIAYDTLLQAVDDKVPVGSDGLIEPGYCTWLSQQVTNQLDLQMKAKGEILASSCYIDPTQDVTATSELNVVVGVQPYGYSSIINVTLGFVNPAQ